MGSVSQKVTEQLQTSRFDTCSRRLAKATALNYDYKKGHLNRNTKVQLTSCLQDGKLCVKCLLPEQK